MSIQGNQYYSIVKDATLSPSNLLHGVNGVLDNDVKNATIALAGGNTAASAFVILTEAQLRQAAAYQLVINSSGAFGLTLAPSGITALGAPSSTCHPKCVRYVQGRRCISFEIRCNWNRGPNS